MRINTLYVNSKTCLLRSNLHKIVVGIAGKTHTGKLYEHFVPRVRAISHFNYTGFGRNFMVEKSTSLTSEK